MGRAWQAARLLGYRQAALYALYQLKLKSGWLRLKLPVGVPVKSRAFPARRLFHLPDAEKIKNALGEAGLRELIQEAEEIVSGKVRLFGGNAVPLQLEPSAPLAHALTYGNEVNCEDIKFTWEPARFGWAVVLARAYHVTGDDRYPRAFWSYLHKFQTANPINLGPNWASGQEVALRLLAILFAGEVMCSAASSANLEFLAGVVEQSAARLPATLIYARAQNNNHLLTESLGLLTAGIWLDCQKWTSLGWKWLNWGFQNQIADDGTYIQHSTNYHRLMLQTALWMDWIARGAGLLLSNPTKQKLSAAVEWIMAHMDRESGRAVNLGNNDGALILPLSTGGTQDYRQTVQSANAAFCNCAAFVPGAWDEACCWLGLDHATRCEEPISVSNRIESEDGWAAMRVAKFSSRPAHADQLHVEIWNRGENLALDAGTYLYNGQTPWDNGLVTAQVHNTVMVDGFEPMRRAGRFLWVDWDQARLLARQDAPCQRAFAEREGYQSSGIRHQRILEYAGKNHWKVTDHLLPVGEQRLHRFSIQWLLMDCDWQLSDRRLLMSTGLNCAEISMGCEGAEPIHFNLARAGERVAGTGDVNPLRGWVSPTYGVRLPALSLQWVVQGSAPVTITTDWILGQNKTAEEPS